METTTVLAHILIGVIALLHIYILILEMFLWTTRGPKVFKSIPKQLFEPTKKLAANQGLYNGFLAAGLIWSLFISDVQWSDAVAQFFLCCIGVAGIYGAITAQRSILYIQTMPAAIALILLALA
jgi:putative membrane protein